jgi:zinc/manganese transport system permease protein
MIVHSGLDFDILGPALVAGLLVLATHVPLGLIVLRRGIIFIDIALAQVAALGVVFGAFIWGEIGNFAIQASAVVAAIGAAGLFIWTDKRFPREQEALIGITYVFAAALQLILLASNPSGSEHLKDLLVGQILWVTPLKLLQLAAMYAPIVALWAMVDLSRHRILFYGVFAIAITISVQIVGMLLVFASLIIPALAARVGPPRLQHILAYNIGAVGYAGGLLLSGWWDVPTGAAIVCVLVPVAAVSACLIRLIAGVQQQDDLPRHGHVPSAAE